MLSADHPIQCVMGELMIQEELATKNQQLTFGVIAEDCMEWAHEIRDVMVEIASDAERIAKRVELYASDGIFDASEREQLLADSREIATEAMEGRIV